MTLMQEVMLNLELFAIFGMSVGVVLLFGDW